MAEEIHYNDIGTTFKIRFVDNETEQVIDISAATTKQIKFKGPSGAVKTKTADFTTDGTDGYIEYITVDGDLNELGNWIIQGYVSAPLYANHTATEAFQVKKNL